MTDKPVAARQFQIHNLSVASFPVAESRVRPSVADTLSRILSDYARGGKAYIPPRDLQFLLGHIDQLSESEEGLAAIDNAVKMQGLPEKWMVKYITVRGGDIALENLSDLSEEAQDFCLRKNIAVGQLIDKIPQLTTVSAALLKAAVAGSDTSEEVFKFLLFKYDSELSGMGLRLPVLMRYPNLVFSLPSTTRLSLNEKKALVKADPETYKAFTDKEPSLVRLYTRLMKKEMPDANEEDDGLEVSKEANVPIEKLLDRLKLARLAGDAGLAEKIEKELTAVNSKLAQVLGAKDKPNKVEPDDGAERLPNVPITWQDLTGFFLRDPTSSAEYLVLSHMRFHDASDLPEAVSANLAKYLRTLDSKPNNYLRLRDAKTSPDSPIAHLLVGSEQLQSIHVTKKLVNSELDDVIATERMKNWNRVNRVLDHQFSDVSPTDYAKPAPAQTLTDNPETVETLPDDQPAMVEEPVTKKDDRASFTDTHKQLSHLTKFVKGLAKLKKVTDDLLPSKP